MRVCRKPYPSDVGDEESSLITSYLLLKREDAGQREHEPRDAFNGLYSLPSGRNPIPGRRFSIDRLRQRGRLGQWSRWLTGTDFGRPHERAAEVGMPKIGRNVVLWVVVTAGQGGCSRRIANADFAHLRTFLIAYA